MKVLQFINSIGAGGAEKLLVDALIKYNEKDIQVDLLAITDIPSPFLEKLNRHPQIKVMFLGKGLNVYNPIHILKLNKYFREYDVIHVHLFPAMYWTSLAKLISTKRHKIVFTEHNVTNRRRNKFFFKLVDRLIYKNFNKIVSISDSVDESLRHHLGNSFSNIVKIYNGIDLEEIKQAQAYSKSELDLPENSIALLQVSSFTPQKDQKTLIKSLLYLPKEVVVLFAGDGPLRDECEQLAQKLGLEDRVYFLGIRSDVPRLLKTSDIVVLSTHYEGLSLASVEGLVSGNPFIASDVPGLTEVVIDAGLLIPDNDDQVLAEQVNKLIGDRGFYDSVVQKCMQRAEKFNIDNMVDNYYKLYQSCVDVDK